MSGKTRLLGRRRLLGLLAATAPAVLWAGRAAAQDKPAGLDALAAIKTRRSVRAYTADPVTDAQVEEILRCGMQAPAACNQQPWQFVVVRERATLAKVGGINPYAAYAKAAPVAILVAGDLSLEKCGGYWIEDTSACAQNMLLAAHALGLGAVWTGIYPLPERVEAFRALLAMPENVTPMALLVIGHPAEQPAPQDRYRPERVHREKW
ncbi:nitroreductase family protein [Solidesulfovibrio sp.]|uniref:nitroreductase family protein n=1 Tax=Solidesulfovibrio sp. TaxID=2910990 RepID=UPI002B21D669|nr:nitroreductase family protein [Solidesulfovibrio sp.]MEA4855738.1 nitroreductase family protein [Solidesulfovibrio sp.]